MKNSFTSKSLKKMRKREEKREDKSQATYYNLKMNENEELDRKWLYNYYINLQYVQ